MNQALNSLPIDYTKLLLAVGVMVSVVVINQITP